MIERKLFEGFGECLWLTNGSVEVICSLEFGPRILSYRRLGDENVLGLCPENRIETPDGVYEIMGGHRLWIGPENWPVTYANDSHPVEVDIVSDEEFLVRQPFEPVSATQKWFSVRLDGGTKASIQHTVKNAGGSSLRLAPWALTIMRAGGEVWIPNEPYGAHGPENLLPSRRWITWPYTNLADSRYDFREDGLAVKISDEFAGPQKIGVMNSLGRVEYRLPEVKFVKSYSGEPGEYPDLGSNTEIFSAGGFVEIETLARLQTLEPAESAHHLETWELV